ncbi:DUF4396 domain-containing protein [Dyella sp. KULCS107]|uniref:DUF4396 domain-containing protein n=1 Tax=Dyella sp. KULCS107 TaxID=3422216 RepID=UPI003D6E913C
MTIMWLTTIAQISLALAVACALWIVLDILRGHRQPMAIMHVVWPVTALYAGPLGLWAYWRWGRPRARNAAQHDDSKSPGESHQGTQGDNKEKPSPQSVALAASHCGSGCTLGDLLVESLLLAFPVVWFGSELLTGWLLDYVAAFVIGIAFQYFTIKPMTDQSPGQAFVSALKADTLSLTAWQVGMYGWMAIAIFLIFGHRLDKSTPVFWFMMQIAMLCGFLAAYPVNAWLLRRGIKEAM